MHATLTHKSAHLFAHTRPAALCFRTPLEKVILAADLQGQLTVGGTRTIMPLLSTPLHAKFSRRWARFRQCSWHVFLLAGIAFRSCLCPVASAAVRINGGQSSAAHVRYDRASICDAVISISIDDLL